MGPRYPSDASRVPRSTKTRDTAEASNRELPARYGPSRATAITRAPPIVASAHAGGIKVRHGMVVEADASRCGNADPIVSAPISTPGAAPRRVSNQPAATFMPGGYTHASAAPVMTRSPINIVAASARTGAAFSQAATGGV